MHRLTTAILTTMIIVAIIHYAFGLILDKVFYDPSRNSEVSEMLRSCLFAVVFIPLAFVAEGIVNKKRK